MNLIAELPGLDEMEQQADPAPWYAALKQIHAGDSEKLEAASAWLRTTNANRAIIEAMDRVVAMAKLMEGGA